MTAFDPARSGRTVDDLLELASACDSDAERAVLVQAAICALAAKLRVPR